MGGGQRSERSCKFHIQNDLNASIFVVTVPTSWFVESKDNRLSTFYCRRISFHMRVIPLRCVCVTVTVMPPHHHTKHTNSTYTKKYVFPISFSINFSFS